MLLDTSIFIDYLRGREPASRAVIATRAGSAVLMHAIVAAELISGVLNRSELRRTLSLISSCRLLIPDESDIRRALRLLESHSLSESVSWNDCLIAATALRLKRAVVTTNEKHFRPIRGLRVIRPY